MITPLFYPTPKHYCAFPKIKYVLVKNHAPVSTFYADGIFYLYLGGIFGVMLTLVNVITIGSIGVALTTALAVFGQLVFSSLVDHFGLFGLDKYKFNPKKLIGFMIVLIGLVIMTIA